jgi:putative hydrolase of the HAD superfamily
MNPQAFPKAIFLDLDDTILDDSDVEPCWTLACEEAAASTAGLDSQLLKQRIYDIRDWYWSDAERHKDGRQDLRAAGTRIVQSALEKLGIRDAVLAARIANRYRDLRDEGMAALPGAIETLERLRSLDIPLALITNGSATTQRAKIERFDLARHFVYIGIEGEVGWGKPDERAYVYALKALNCEPERAWMVGDNLEWDV